MRNCAVFRVVHWRQCTNPRSGCRNRDFPIRFACPCIRTGSGGNCGSDCAGGACRVPRCGLPSPRTSLSFIAW
ncbi:hypothetical protein Geu3261_0215_009 [Komagataeibacter europaeus NBRC 3261]|uniref:Uncharacterized protein n=1 Tax=Komagataeibacter europaeus NBRC 3261 TaxID=1234669 RepID=A0A0D6Q4B5_KOMEU|nr:hypothetical protein Geu3261_0215_009 [Komagataeibacter europaeus NBRC 3261]